MSTFDPAVPEQQRIAGVLSTLHETSDGSVVGADPSVAAAEAMTTGMEPTAPTPTTEQSKVRDSKNLSLAQNTNPEMEKLAAEVAEKFATHCTKLKDLKPQIEKIRDWFKKDGRGSVTLLGCRSFKQYCEKKLNRKEQTVYAMLGDYSKKTATKKRQPAGTGDESGTVPNGSTTHQKLVIAEEDVERLRTGVNAARRFFEAQDASDQPKANEAKKEFLAIAEARPLTSLIFGDQPNYRMLLIDLLSDVEKVGEKLPVPLTRKCQAIRKRLGMDDASFGVKPEDRLQPTETQSAQANSATA